MCGTYHLLSGDLSTRLPPYTINKYSLMFLYLSNASSLIAESFSRIISTQLLDQISRIPSDTAWEFHGIDTLEDLVVSLHWISAREWWWASKQLKHENTWNNEDSYVKEDAFAEHSTNVHTKSDFGN